MSNICINPNGLSNPFFLSWSVLFKQISFDTLGHLLL
jgi:hypothetical protein